ncbi:MAG: hypothetical protein ABDH25_04065 [Dictyoglomaceae bacterium]
MDNLVKSLLNNSFVFNSDVIIVISDYDYKDDTPLPKGFIKVQPSRLMEIIEKVIEDPKGVISVFKKIDKHNWSLFKTTFCNELDSFGYRAIIGKFKLRREEIKETGLSNKEYKKIAKEINNIFKSCENLIIAYSNEFNKKVLEKKIEIEEDFMVIERIMQVPEDFDLGESD